MSRIPRPPTHALGGEGTAAAIPESLVHNIVVARPAIVIGDMDIAVDGVEVDGASLGFRR